MGAALTTVSTGCRAVPASLYPDLSHHVVLTACMTNATPHQAAPDSDICHWQYQSTNRKNVGHCGCMARRENIMPRMARTDNMACKTFMLFLSEGFSALWMLWCRHYGFGWIWQFKLFDLQVHATPNLHRPLSDLFQGQR